MGAGLGKFVGRFAHQVLGHEVVAPAHADEGLLRMRCRVAGNVGPGVASAHNQHALAAKLVAVFVGDRMAHFAVKLPRKLRHARVPVHASGADHGVVQAACAVRQIDHPARGAVLLDANHVGVELDALAQPEGVGKAAQVGQDLAV
ncbi:hypothetical protein D3C72_2000100 [compost metagenome]